jgi:phosphoglycolate phosphatase
LSAQSIRVYFFDLDGTLADSRAGLDFCVRAALRALGAADPAEEALAALLGAPLPKVFATLVPGISESNIAGAIAAYRAAYDATGIDMNTIYPGVIGMLRAIAGKAAKSWIVTSKPQHYAVAVTRNLGIGDYLQGVVGAGLDEKDTKTSLVASALHAAAATAADAVMVGDRFYDVVGARDNGVMPVGALWGYGSYGELHGAGCEHFANSPKEFQERFVG